MSSRLPDPLSFLPLPHLAFQVLLSLAGRELHGYAIAKEVEARCAPGPRPSTGSLYLAIGRLQENGLIEEAGSEGRRTVYRLTADGRRVAEAEAARMRGLVSVAEHRDLLSGAREDG